MRSHASRTESAPFASRRVTAAALALSALMVAGACSRSRAHDDTALAADLQHDLELASTTGIELAGWRRGGTQVVSAVEAGLKSAPKRASSTRTPKASGHRQHAPSPKVEDPAPAPAPENVDAATVVAAAGPEVEQPAPAAEPQSEPATVPSPVSWPNGGGTVGRGSRGVGIGTAIGAIVLGSVIRGGVVGGVDDCDERDRSRHRSRMGTIGTVVGTISGPAMGRVGLPSGTFPHH